jgi:signal transduction histidine kinase
MLELLVHFALDLLPAARSAGIPMHVELALVQRYLELLALRMGERLRWTVEVPEALRQALVPSMGLLTLVENAVQHGIGRLGRGGTVQLRASVQPDNLQVEVLDDGVGLRSGAGANVGLSNLRAKLLLMAGETARFELRNRAEGGVRAVITLPLRQGLHPETRSKAAPGADTSSARPRLPWRLVLAGAVAVWAWQLLEAHLGADPTGAAMPRALLEVPLAAACMLGLAVLARRAAHGGLQAVLLVGGALLAGSALGIGLSHLLLGGAGPDAPSLQSLRCAAPGDCARGTKDALTVALQAALFGALFAWAARLQMGHAQTQQRALTLAAHSAELRRHAAAARLRAARARAEPADVARLLQRLHERYRASPLDGETMLDALTAYLRSVAETAHSPRVSLQREIHGLRAFAALERAAQDVEPGELLRVELDDGVDLAVTVAPLSLLQPLRLLWAATPAARLSLRLRRGPPGRLHARIACALPRPAVMPGVEGDTLVAALTPLSAHAVRQPDGSLHWTLDVETC